VRPGDYFIWSQRRLGNGKVAVVMLVDGTTVSMPDTPENQKVYPQPESQKEGVGFPIARLVCGNPIILWSSP